MSGEDGRPGYCERHDLEWELLTACDRCPLCVEEERQEAERRHRQTRDPAVEPY